MIHFANASEPSEDASSPWEGLGDMVPAAAGDSLSGMTVHLSVPNHLSTEPTTESGPWLDWGSPIPKFPPAQSFLPIITPVLGSPTDAELYASCSEMFIAQVPETTWRALRL